MSNMQLKAVIKAEDRFSGPMRKFMSMVDQSDRVIGQASKSTSMMSKAAGTAGTSINRMSSTASRSFEKVRGSASGAITSITGLVAAYGAASASVKAFQATIGAAAQREFSTLTTSALFKGDTAAADAYFSYIQKRAIDSPLFEADDYFKTSKSFVTITKNLDELKGLTSIAERLGASDPLQGIEGASVALRELAGGDGVSLVERFELPRSVVNTIKELPLKQQIKAMDELLNSMGYTNELLEKQGTTALGQYRGAVGKLKAGLLEMGVGGLEKLRPQLERFNRALDGDGFKRFVDVGSTALTRFVNGSIYVFDKGYNAFSKYMDKLNSDEKFQALTWDQKFERVLDDAFKALSSYIENSKTVKDFTDKALVYGTKFGVALGEGVLKGAIQFAIDNPELAAVLGGGWLAKNGKIPKLGGGGAASEGAAGSGGKGGKSLILNPYVLGGAAAAAAAGYGASVWEAQKTNENSIYSAAINGGVSPQLKAASAETMASSPISDTDVNALQSFLHGEKRATGLDYVPYDNKPILAHRGEAILPKPQADEYRSGRGTGGNVSVNVTVNGLTVRENADIERIANELAQQIWSARAAVTY
ncbi:hypothetical protein [Paenibacillus hamazuiensis]|uniref:hypothetical protein n=1 Tax=Paenibacillus hamazuiensis TaxID=2936508 RepID=UPI0020101D76|nr:hypothetical protein [Paenibacillus hamazuiensis]